jgi:hypothetical protein
VLDVSFSRASVRAQRFRIARRALRTRSARQCGSRSYPSIIHPHLQLEAKNGPNGEFLIALCRHSDQVLETLLLLAGGTEHVRARQIVAAKQKLQEILNLVNQLES